MVGTTNQSETCWRVERHTDDMEWCVKECRGAWRAMEGAEGSEGKCGGYRGMWKGMKGHSGDMEHG